MSFNYYVIKGIEETEENMDEEERSWEIKERVISHLEQTRFVHLKLANNCAKLVELIKEI